MVYVSCSSLHNLIFLIFQLLRPLPSDGGFLEPDGIEKTWNVKQQDLISGVDILSLKNLYDMVLPGSY